MSLSASTVGVGAPSLPPPPSPPASSSMLASRRPTLRLRRPEGAEKEPSSLPPSEKGERPDGPAPWSPGVAAQPAEKPPWREARSPSGGQFRLARLQAGRGGRKRGTWKSRCCSARRWLRQPPTSSQQDCPCPLPPSSLEPVCGAAVGAAAVVLLARHAGGRQRRKAVLAANDKALCRISGAPHHFIVVAVGARAAPLLLAGEGAGAAEAAPGLLHKGDGGDGGAAGGVDNGGGTEQHTKCGPGGQQLAPDTRFKRSDTEQCSRLLPTWLLPRLLRCRPLLVCIGWWPPSRGSGEAPSCGRGRWECHCSRIAARSGRLEVWRSEQVGPSRLQRTLRSAEARMA